jgi:hypothetical protein
MDIEEFYDADPRRRESDRVVDGFVVETERRPISHRAQETTT